MPTLEFPGRYRAHLLELAARLLESRRPKTPLESLARELLVGAHDILMSTGHDGVLAALAVDTTDVTALADDEALHGALVRSLTAADLDGGGPRAARPGQLADAVIATLGLAVTDDTSRTIEVDGTIKPEVVAAVTGAIEPALAVPAIRTAIIAEARARCEEAYLGAFDKVAAQLDERGMRVEKQPKVPLDASQAIQRHLADARDLVIGRAVRTALDRAKALLERTSPEAAARIDQPITHALTLRDVAVRRACNPRLLKRPEVVADSVLASVIELAHITWRVPAVKARPYAASASFAVGELIDHPKFGLGTVLVAGMQRVDVEFGDGKHTLVHRK